MVSILALSYGDGGLETMGFWEVLVEVDGLVMMFLWWVTAFSCWSSKWLALFDDLVVL